MYFAADDSLVSASGNFTNPVEFTLRADQNESDEVRLYAMCDTGYQATSTSVALQGTSAARWQLAADSTGTPGSYGAGPLNLGTVGAGSGGRVYFWAKAEAIDTEEIGVDDSVTLKLEGVGAAV